MSKEELDLLTQIGRTLVKIQNHLAKKETKETLTGFEEIVKAECEEAIPMIREYVKDSDLYA